MDFTYNTSFLKLFSVNVFINDVCSLLGMFCYSPVSELFSPDVSHFESDWNSSNYKSMQLHSRHRCSDVLMFIVHSHELICMCLNKPGCQSAVCQIRDPWCENYANVLSLVSLTKSCKCRIYALLIIVYCNLFKHIHFLAKHPQSATCYT